MNSSIRRKFIRRSVGVLALAGAATGLPVLAQDAAKYPTKPITLVVPHAPGGSVDGVARIYAEFLKDELGQSVVVENKPGASGMIGAGHVARQPADGYTLYLNASIHSINPLLYKSTIKFDAVKDFTAISEVAKGALIFSVHPGVPAKTPQELVKVVKQNPSKYSFITSGFGSAGHLAMALFLADNGLGDQPIVLYKGGGPALTDLVGGQVSGIMDPMLSSAPFVKAGKLRALAVTGKERSPLLPDVPTMIEQGVKGFEFYSWYGVWAPAHLPEAIRAKLDAATSKVVHSAAYKEKLAALGFDAEYRDSKDFSAYIQQEMKRYDKIIQDAKIKSE